MKTPVTAGHGTGGEPPLAILKPPHEKSPFQSHRSAYAKLRLESRSRHFTRPLFFATMCPANLIQQIEDAGTMEHWYMLSLMGKDRPGLVAEVSAALCKAGCNLGDSSMARLGANFSIMVMVQWDGTIGRLKEIVQPISQALSLTPHINELPGGMEHHVEPDVRISVYANDRLGIVEDVTTSLAEAGLNILHLDSNTDLEKGSPNKTYYLHIEGTVSKGLDPLYAALDRLTSEKDMNAQLIPINPEIQ